MFNISGSERSTPHQTDMGAPKRPCNVLSPLHRGRFQLPYLVRGGYSHSAHVDPTPKAPK